MSKYGKVEVAARGNFAGLPPVGAYVAEIKNVRFVEADGDKQRYNTLEMMIDITEGDYTGRFTEVYNDQKEKFGKATYKGIFKLRCPSENDGEDADWVARRFGNNLWCVQDSNPGYEWDEDETKLKGKKVGINIRKYLYTYNGEDRETVEIGQLETIADVKAGKCKEMRPRDKRKKEEDSTDGSNFTDVSKAVDVPW